MLSNIIITAEGKLGWQVSSGCLLHLSVIIPVENRQERVTTRLHKIIQQTRHATRISISYQTKPDALEKCLKVRQKRWEP